MKQQEMLKKMQHQFVCTDGLWCTDKPNLIADPKNVLFRIDNSDELAIIDAMLRKGNSTNWIKCADRLPEPESVVLASENGCVDLMMLADRGWQEVYTGTQTRPTHWMPLPAAPQEEE